MIELNRTKKNRWIIQKNISSSELMEAYIQAMHEQNNAINEKSIKENLKGKNAYRGRSYTGSAITMGVRMSQMCFYMFGYKDDTVFIPSPMTQLLLNGGVAVAETILVNLFSMQYPHPYSKTPSNFKIFIGRLIVKLLLEPRLEKKLYIDECVWFLPFIEQIDKDRYEDLVDSIVTYRKLTYEKKEALFHSVPDYNAVFANCMHEFNYYFARIFEGFGVFDIIEDKSHNSGKLFHFRHGNGSTDRSDAYKSRKNNSGYIQINNKIIQKAQLLSDNFSCFEIPSTQADTNITRSEWIRDLYEFEPLKYISMVARDFINSDKIISTIKQMIYDSKFGSRDGKAFEKSLKDAFDLFREVKDLEIISGSGDTDILCHVLDDEPDAIPYKMNVDAKSTGKSTQSINAKRIMLHVTKNGSKYCIIVSPRFASGVKLDIIGEKIVAIKAETLANYCLKECLSSEDGYANYTVIDKLIEQNYGYDLSNQLDDIISKSHGMATYAKK